MEQPNFTTGTTAPPAPPVHTFSRFERDLKWSIVAREEVAPALYKALQADALGVIDAVPFADAPPAIRELLTAAAERAVASVSSLRRAHAEQKALLRLLTVFDGAKRGYDTVKPLPTTPERAAQNALLVLRACVVKPDVLTSVLDAYTAGLMEGPSHESTFDALPIHQLDALGLLFEIARIVATTPDRLTFLTRIEGVVEGFKDQLVTFTDESDLECLICAGVGGCTPRCPVSRLDDLVKRVSKEGGL